MQQADDFLADLPRILVVESLRLAYAAVVAPQTLLGVLDLVRGWPSAVRKRRLIRARRTVADAAVRRWFVMPGEKTREAPARLA